MYLLSYLLTYKTLFLVRWTTCHTVDLSCDWICLEWRTSNFLSGMNCAARGWHAAVRRTVVPWPVHLRCRPSKSPRTSLFLQRLPRPASGSPFHCCSRTFSVAGPQVWNCLPPKVTWAPSLATFCTRLKTFLFTESYPDIRLIWHCCVYTLAVCSGP